MKLIFRILFISVLSTCLGFVIYHLNVTLPHSKDECMMTYSYPNYNHLPFTSNMTMSSRYMDENGKLFL